MPFESCTICGDEAYFVCNECQNPTCDQHITEDGICKECAKTPDAVAEAKAKLESFDIKVEPLKDDEGVTHKGKLIAPTGDAYMMTTCTAVAAMSDEELIRFAEAYRQKVRDTEALLDKRRIVLNTIEMESDDRHRKRRLRDRNQKVKSVAGPSLTKNSAKPVKPKTAADVFALFSKAGITPEMLKNLAAEKRKREEQK